jgi:hypothetical protein
VFFRGLLFWLLLRAPICDTLNRRRNEWGFKDKHSIRVKCEGLCSHLFYGVIIRPQISLTLDLSDNGTSGDILYVAGNGQVIRVRRDGEERKRDSRIRFQSLLPFEGDFSERIHTTCSPFRPTTYSNTGFVSNRTPMVTGKARQACSFELFWRIAFADIFQSKLLLSLC